MRTCDVTGLLTRFLECRVRVNSPTVEVAVVVGPRFSTVLYDSSLTDDRRHLYFNLALFGGN